MARAGRNVEFSGWVSDEELERAYAGCRAVVLASGPCNVPVVPSLAGVWLWSCPFFPIVFTCVTGCPSLVYSFLYIHIYTYIL